MARYEITGPDGGKYEVTAPEGASQDEVFRVFQAHIGQQQPRESTSTLAAAAEGIGQGVTFGLSDEIEGVGRAALGYVMGDRRSFGERYDEGLAKPRARQKQAKETNPIAYYGGEIGSAIAVPFGAARLGVGRAIEAVPGVGRAVGLMGFGASARAANSGIPARMLAGAREGAAYAGLYGFNQAEGGDGTLTDQVLNRAGAGIQSAALGAAVGGALPPVVDTARAVMSGVSAPVRGMLDPRQFGREKFAEAMLRDVVPENPRGAMDPALVRQGFQRIDDRVTSMTSTNPRAMAADAGGENTRNLLRAAANMPNSSAEKLRKNLDARQGTQWARIEKDTTRSLGGGDNLWMNQQTAKNVRGQNATKAYTAAYSQPVRPQAAAELRDFIEKRPYMQTLYDRTMQSVVGKEGQQVAAEIQRKPWEFLHRVKIQMDREIGKLRRGQPDSATNWDMGDLIELKNQFNDLLKKHNPGYKAANAKFADESALINAAEEGFEAFKTMPPEMLRRQINQLEASSSAEAWAFRRGASRKLLDDIRRGNANLDRTDGIFSSPDMQKRLEAMFPTRRMLRDFQRNLVIEAKMADTRKAVQGNSTTAKQLAQGQEAGQPLRDVASLANAATGRLAPMMEYLGRQMQRFSGLTPATAQAILDEAMRKGTFRNERAWQRAIARAEREPAFRAQLVQMLTAGAGATVSEP